MEEQSVLRSPAFGMWESEDGEDIIGEKKVKLVACMLAYETEVSLGFYLQSRSLGFRNSISFLSM
jgi:hypothetical protein